MEIDLKQKKQNLEKEVATLTGQLQQIDNEINRFNQARNNQVALILKKQGALEELQSWEGKEPKVN